MKFIRAHSRTHLHTHTHTHTHTHNFLTPQQVHVKAEDNEALLLSEGVRQEGGGEKLFREAELKKSGSSCSSGTNTAITNITQSTITQCSSALCMSASIDFWRETDSRGLLPWNFPDSIFVAGGTPALPHRAPTGISGCVQPIVQCTLASYLQHKSPPSPGAALLLLHRVMLMLKALHASSLVAVGLCSAAIVCVRPRHPDEYYEGVMGSAMFGDEEERQRWVWRVMCDVRSVTCDV